MTTAVPLDKTLPDPRKCDTKTESRAFSAANTAVQTLSGNLTSQSRERKREYNSYDEHTRLNMARSAIEIGINKTARNSAINLELL